MICRKCKREACALISGVCPTCHDELKGSVKFGPVRIAESAASDGEKIAAQTGGDVTIVADTPSKIEAYRLLALKGALKLECKGMRRSHGESAYSIIKREFDLRGSREAVLHDFEALLRDMEVLV